VLPPIEIIVPKSLVIPTGMEVLVRQKTDSVTVGIYQEKVTHTGLWRKTRKNSIADWHLTSTLETAQTKTSEGKRTSSGTWSMNLPLVP